MYAPSFRYQTVETLWNCTFSRNLMRGDGKGWSPDICQRRNLFLRKGAHTVLGPQQRTEQSQNNDGSEMGGSTPWPGLHNSIPFTLLLNLNLITRPPRRGEMAQKVWRLLCSLTAWDLSLASTGWRDLTPQLFTDTSKFPLTSRHGPGVHAPLGWISK